MSDEIMADPVVAISEQNEIAANGSFTVEELAAAQTNLIETKEAPTLRPANIAGVSNDPSLSNEALTAKVANLEYLVTYLYQHALGMDITSSQDTA